MPSAQNTNPQPDLFSIIHEDEDLLVINKPAGLVCHPTKTDEYSSLVGRVRLYFQSRERLSWHLVNRLDRETSGVVLVAKNDLAAREIRRIWESRDVQKVYLAIIHGWPEQDERIINAPLGKDVRSKVAIKDCVRSDGAPSVTSLSVLRRFEHPKTGKLTLLQVRPETGRKHQIRIHLSHIGHPILGDKLYGKDEECYLAFVERRQSQEQRELLVVENHALHAKEVRFQWRGHDRVFCAEPEPWFREIAIKVLPET